MIKENIEFIRYSDEYRDLWDNLVINSKNGNFLHQRDYMDYHAHRFDEQSVLIIKRGKPIAVFPSNRVTDQVISHSGLTYAGLIYGKKIHAVEILELFKKLEKYYRQMGISKILYKATPHVFHSYPAEEDLYALTRMGARLFRRDLSSVIRLDNRIKFSDSRKCTIRKSEKQGLTIREGDFFDEYHKLLVQVIAKFGTEPVHTLLELQLLKERFPDKIRLFGAFEENQLLAGAIIYDFGHIVHTQYLATSEQGKEIGALDFVLAQLIETTFSSHQYFSFGVSTENEGQLLNEGLIFQKEGFGARGVTHDFYEWDLQ
jgi:virulence-associated protein VagC